MKTITEQTGFQVCHASLTENSVKRSPTVISNKNILYLLYDYTDNERKLYIKFSPYAFKQRTHLNKGEQTILCLTNLALILLLNSL